LSQPDFLSLIPSRTESIDVGPLVNNAGFGIAGKFLEHEVKKELALLDVNCRAPLIVTHGFGRQMTKRKRGGIIFISSVPFTSAMTPGSCLLWSYGNLAAPHGANPL
jgi:short-subunit dehydrogenase